MRTKILLLSTSIIASTLISCKPTSEEQKKPDLLNFVVIFTDEMQFSDLGCYGGVIPTPNIDKLAAEGILFSNAYTPASMCTPSRYALLTGQFPGRCSAPSFDEINPVNEPYNIAWNSWITQDKKTLPRVLSENGYVTGMSGKWHIGEVPEGIVLPEFEPDADLNSPEINRKLQEQQIIYRKLVENLGGFDEAYSVIWHNYDGHDIKALHFHNFPWMSKGALSFLDKQKQSDKPFFLYLAPTAVHGPNHVADLSRDVSYTPGGRDSSLLPLQLDITALKEELSKPGIKNKHRYAGLAQTDHLVGQIIDKLMELGKDKNTVVIFMADHNIEPGKATSYEKGIHVPFIVHWPGKTSGSISDAMVQNTDIYPTILEAAGITLPEDPVFDGLSILSIIDHPDQSVRQYIFAENGYTRSVSDGTYKYIALRYPESLIDKMESGKIDYVPSYVKAWPQAHSAIAINCFPNYFDQDQLYNIKDDPYELENIYEAMLDSEVLIALQESLEVHLKTFKHPFGLAKIPFLETEAYRKLTETNLAYDLLSIPWLSRDHGFILWPQETQNP